MVFRRRYAASRHWGDPHPAGWGRAEDRDTSGDLHYAVAKITLDPDHVKARSFAVDVGNGTTVRLEEATGVRRVWKDGRVVESNEKCTVEAGGARERRQQ